MYHGRCPVFPPLLFSLLVITVCLLKKSSASTSTAFSKVHNTAVCGSCKVDHNSIKKGDFEILRKEYQDSVFACDSKE